MEQSIIIESNQTIAKKNYAVDYGKTDDTEITNNKWKIKLPKSIALQPGDRISYYSSAIKTQGLSDEGIELLGESAENETLVDNKMKMDLGYYVSNNWLNNTPLPKGLSTLRDFNNHVDNTHQNLRLFNFQDTFHSYNICDETPGTDYQAYLSDYGGVNLGTQITGIPLSDIQPWINNGAVSLNERADKLDRSLYGMSNGNAVATNHLKLYTPDTTRFYLGQTDFIGFYNNGYDSYHNIPIPGSYSKKWSPLTSEAVVESNIGFNSPIVVAQKITESLNDPNLADDRFVKPQLIDYKNVTAKPITSLKNHYQVEDTLQVVDETCKNYPTTFGKMVYDINNGVENFSINKETKDATGIAYPTLGQRAKYFYNCLATGDINRTQAISELFSDLNDSKNIQTLNANNLTNSSFYTGNIEPESSVTGSGTYPTSSPYNFGESCVIFDDLEGFATNFTQNEIDQVTSNILFRSDTETDYAAIKKPSLNDKHLNLENGRVVMSNIIANDSNFEKLKKVFDYLEKPSSDEISINYSDQTFLDSLYASWEIGRTDDRYTQSVYNIHNAANSNGTFTNKRIGNGIILPVALAPTQSVALQLEPEDAESKSYIQYKNRMRLPIYAGLVASEDNISELVETGSSGNINFTYINEMDNNKMYEYDFYTRYNENRTPKTNGVILPSSTKFSFTDSNGKYFDDSKIKKLGLGCVVGYRNLVETGDDVLEFGLGNSPNANQFSLYSVDTTNNYSVNSSNFINISSDSDLTKFGDNSVQSLSTNNTIYLTQNSTNAYSETADKVDISATNAMVIEYESPQPIMPSKMEVFQQASFPDPNAVGTTEVSTALAGANGTESFTAHLTASSYSPANNASNVYDNTLQTRYVFSNPHLNVSAGYEFTTPQIVNKYRIWGYHDGVCTCKPTAWELRASINKATYDAGGTGAYQVLDTKSGINTATFPSATIVASNNLNTSYEASFTNTTSYGYYVLYITANDGDGVNTTLYEFALYGDKPGEICIAGAGTHRNTSDFTPYASPTQSSENNVNVVYNNSLTDRYTFNNPRNNVFFAYDLTTAQIVNKYRIWGYPNGLLTPWPANIEFRASKVDRASYNENDPDTYDVLDKQTITTAPVFTNTGNASSQLIGAYTSSFVNTTAYTYYVLHIINNGGDPTNTHLYQFAIYKDDTYQAVAGNEAGATNISQYIGQSSYPNKGIENIFNNVVSPNATNSGYLSNTPTMSNGVANTHAYLGCELSSPQIITKYNVCPINENNTNREANARGWTFVGCNNVNDLINNTSNLVVLHSVNLAGAVSRAGVIDGYPNVNIIDNSNTPANTISNLFNNYEISNTTPFSVYGIIPNKNYGSQHIGMIELGLYKTALSITNSRLPKEIILQGQKLNDNIWTTIEQNVLTTEPSAAGFVAPSTLPQNPNLANLTAPYDETFNQSNQQYKKVRMVIPQAFTDNSINIGEWILRKKNHIKTYLGNNDSAFDATKLTYEVVLTTRDENNAYSVDDTPGVSVNLDPTTTKSNLQDASTFTYSRLSMNTDSTYSTTSNVLNFGERYMKIIYTFPSPSPINNFFTWSNNDSTLLSKLMKHIEIHGFYKENNIDKYDILFDDNLSTTTPTATTAASIDSETAYSPKETLGFNTTNKKYDAIIIIVKSNFDTTSNNVVLSDILFSGYDTGTNFYKEVPFIGMVCRHQITSANKYKIPLPIEGEFNSLSRSFQNNEFSLINSWERKVVNDDRGVVVADIKLESSAAYFTTGLNQVLTAELSGGDPKVKATVSLTQTYDRSGFLEFINVTDITITNNGSYYKTPPTIIYKLNGNELKTNDAGWGGSPPKIEIIMGDFKFSYNKGTLVNNEPNFPYITIGSNDINCEFDTTQSRMNFNKMHTLMKQGQETNELSRYYDNSMVFNSGEALISPDTESGNDVMKIHNKKFYLNSTRAGFTEGISKSNLAEQIIQISNPFIKQKGIASSISGVGIMGLHVGKKDGTYNQVSQFNRNTYTNSLFDKLGFKIEQLLPIFGNQNNVFNRGTHNRYINDNKLAVLKLTNMVKPVTTNGFISATLNQSLNTSNLNYLMGSLDGNNQLEKSVSQISDSLIGVNLPQKFSYSHLLVYSNIVNKYNYVGGQIINDIPCVGSISRTYEQGDFILGNTPGIEYTIDKTKILTDIDVDLRTNLGTKALLGEGSTVTFKIDKIRQLPLVLQEKK